MADITLLSTAQAAPGFTFTYQGGAPICRTCPYRHACLTLDPGRRYEVTKVRAVTHPCALQETDAKVVEVKPVPRQFVVESRGAVVGASVEVSRFSCARLDCPNWSICAGPLVGPKQRFRVERVAPELAECRIGRTLRTVEAI